MARVKFNPQISAENLKRELEKAADSTGLNKEWGNFLTERVRFEARRGKPLNDTRSFPELTDASKSIRAALATQNPTHPAFSPGKSNATFTGQLLDAVAFERKRSGLFELFVKKSRRRQLVTDRRERQVVFNETVDRRLRRGVSSVQFGTRKFEIFTSEGIKSDKKIPRRLKQILLRFLRRQLRSS